MQVLSALELWGQLKLNAAHSAQGVAKLWRSQLSATPGAQIHQSEGPLPSVRVSAF